MEIAVGFKKFTLKGLEMIGYAIIPGFVAALLMAYGYDHNDVLYLGLGSLIAVSFGLALLYKVIADAIADSNL